MDRRLITHANWSLLGSMLLLFLVGLLNLYSASSTRVEDGIQIASFFERQLLWGLLGLVVMVICIIFDYRRLKEFSIPLFIMAVVLLIMVPLFGTSVNGAKRWISLGFTNFQPSEIAKIATLIMCAAMLSRMKPCLGWSDTLLTLLVVGVPCVLIFIQPDLGTALHIFFLVCGVILYHGVMLYVLLPSCAIISFLIGLLWYILDKYQQNPATFEVVWWYPLKAYQLDRILTFINPARDLKGAGYHINQSQIAIGSGEMWGKGFMGGTQSLYRFLPEKHTDFAIAVFSEEWGFVGCVLLILLFCFFLASIVSTVRDSKDRFGSLLCAGVFFYFFWQILINIGMVIGIMPVVGIPLPFISYGGTAMIVNFALLGFVFNVSMRRFMFKTN